MQTSVQEAEEYSACLYLELKINVILAARTSFLLQTVSNIRPPARKTLLHGLSVNFDFLPANPDVFRLWTISNSGISGTSYAKIPYFSGIPENRQNRTFPENTIQIGSKTGKSSILTFLRKV